MEMNIASVIAIANGVSAVYGVTKMVWWSESAEPNDLVVTGTLAVVNTVCMFGLAGMARLAPK